MSKRPKNNSSDTFAMLGDFVKDLGATILGAFGRMLGVAIVAAIFGGVGGGIIGAVYGLPIIAMAIVGAVLAVIVVLVLYYLAADSW